MGFSVAGMAVPSEDSSADVLSRDVIGKKSDTVAGDSLISRSKQIIAALAGVDTEMGLVYFVDGTNGSDSNDGLTPDTALETISAAVGKVVSGDLITVRAGTYAEAVDLDVNAVTMKLENGVLITPAAGTPLTISANYCTVYSPLGAVYCTPVASGTGVVISGNRNYVYNIRVPAGSSGNLGFDITGNGGVITNCRCSGPLVAAFKISGDTTKLEDCCTGGEVGDSSIGYWITGSCDKTRLVECGSGGHETAGYQIDAGCTSVVCVRCTSGAGDGHYSDLGTLTHIDIDDRDSSEYHDHTYPRPDGEGTAGAPVSVQSQVNDETGADDTANYWGDSAQVVAPGVIAVDWMLKGINFFAITTADDQFFSLYRAVYSTLTTRNGGNAWDEGATALTVASEAAAAKFQANDLVLIRTPGYKPGGEIVKVTDVTGAVVTIARQTENSARTGLHWNHTTNDGGNEEMYLCWRDLRHYHTSDIDYSAASSRAFAQQLFAIPRRMQANDGLYVRMINGTDTANSQCQLNMVWSD